MNDSSMKEKNGGRMVWRILLAICVIALAAAAVLRIMKPKDEVVTTPLATVSVKHAQTADISVETSLVGTMAAGDVYYVIPKTAGEIIEIYVAQGDQVAEGDPICKIDNQKQIDAAKISLDSAEVQLKTASDAAATARTNLNRMAALLQSGDISSQAYEQTKSGYDQAVAAKEAAELQKKAAELQYDTQVEFATVTAPTSGKVESESMELNAMASQSSPLCVLTGDGAKKVQFSVTDRLLSALSVGEAIRVEKQGASYEGVITAVGTMPAQTTGLYPIEASVADGGAIQTGANVKVYFPSAFAGGVLAVDTDAVYYDGGKTYVYTITYNDEESSAASAGEAKTDGNDAENAAAAETALEETAANAEVLSSEETGANGAETENGAGSISAANRAATVHKIEVETGLSDGELTEIVSGVDADARIIVSWTSQLYEGAQVQVLPEEA